jgi:hypothetical protein
MVTHGAHAGDSLPSRMANWAISTPWLYGIMKVGEAPMMWCTCTGRAAFGRGVVVACVHTQRAGVLTHAHPHSISRAQHTHTHPGGSQAPDEEADDRQWRAVGRARQQASGNRRGATPVVPLIRHPAYTTSVRIPYVQIRKSLHYPYRRRGAFAERLWGTSAGAAFVPGVRVRRVRVRQGCTVRHDGHRMAYGVWRMDRMGLTRGSYGGDISSGWSYVVCRMDRRAYDATLVCVCTTVCVRLQHRSRPSMNE